MTDKKFKQRFAVRPVPTLITVLFSLISLIFLTGKVETDTSNGGDDTDFILYLFSAWLAVATSYWMAKNRENMFYVGAMLLVEFLGVHLLTPYFFLAFSNLYCHHWHYYSYVTCYDCAKVDGLSPTRIHELCGG